MKQEFMGFVHYAGPPTISYALDAAVEIVALTYIAKIGERELAAAGMLVRQRAGERGRAKARARARESTREDKSPKQTLNPEPAPQG